MGERSGPLEGKAPVLVARVVALIEEGSGDKQAGLSLSGASQLASTVVACLIDEVTCCWLTDECMYMQLGSVSRRRPEGYLLLASELELERPHEKKTRANACSCFSI